MNRRQLKQITAGASEDFKRLNVKFSAKMTTNGFGSLPALPLPSGMNATESRYAEMLWHQQRLGAVHSWEWTGKNPKRSLAVNESGTRRYKPDFYVWTMAGALEIHETKGVLHDGGSIRFDLAAERHPQYVFRMVRWDRVTDTGVSWLSFTTPALLTLGLVGK